MDDVRSRLLAPVGAIAVLAVTAAYVQLSPTPGYTSAPRGDRVAEAANKTTTASQAPSQPRDTIVAARLGSIADTVTISGRVGAADEAPLSFQSPQRIAAVKVNPGDDVDEGQVLVEADRAELARALGAARERLSTASDKLKQAQDVVGRQQQRTEMRQTINAARTQRSVADADAMVKQAESDLERVQQGASPAERRAAEMAVSSAKAAYARADADARKLREGPDDLDYRQAYQAVLTSQLGLQKAQDDYQKLASGPDQAQLRAAERDYISAQNGLTRAQADLQKLVQPDPVAVTTAQREVDRARAALRVAEIAAAAPISSGSSSSSSGSSSNASAASNRALQAERQAAVLNARMAVQSAQERLQSLQAGAPPVEVMMARRNVSTSESALASAKDRLDAARQGADSMTLNQAQLGIETARLTYESASARLTKLSAGTDDPAGAVLSALQSAETALRGAEAQQAEMLARPTPSELATAQENLRKARETQAQARSEANVPPDDPVEQTGYDLGTLQQIADQEQASVNSLENDLLHAQLVAPFSGRVVAVAARAKDGVDAGKAVVTLARKDAEPLILADVPATDGARLAVGQNAALKYSGPMSGDENAPLATVTPIGGTIHVELHPAWANGAAVLGAPVSVSVTTERRDNVVLVPEAALRGSGSVRVLDVMNGDERRQAQVSVGLVVGGDAEIRSGIAAGDQVVLPQ